MIERAKDEIDAAGEADGSCAAPCCLLDCCMIRPFCRTYVANRRERQREREGEGEVMADEVVNINEGASDHGGRNLPYLLLLLLLGRLRFSVTLLMSCAWSCSRCSVSAAPPSYL